MNLPNIHDALEIIKSKDEKLIVECQQHIGENTIRAIAMDSTDGLQRGMKVKMHWVALLKCLLGIKSGDGY